MTDSPNSPFSTPPALPSDYNPANDKPWSAKGRFGRLSFLAWGLLLGLALDVIVFPLMFIFGGLQVFTASNGTPSFNGSSFAILFIPYLAFLYVVFVFYIRRLHDLNKSGWWLLLSFVPLINLFFFLYILLGKGTDGPNRFGPQRPTPQWEQALGWVSVAFMVIGLMVAGLVLSAVFSAVHNHGKFPFPMIPASAVISDAHPSTSSDSTTSVEAHPTSDAAS